MRTLFGEVIEDHMRIHTTVGSNDFSDLRTVLDELESGHTTDGLALGEGLHNSTSLVSRGIERASRREQSCV